MHRLPRRRVLRASGVAALGALAGCGALPGDDTPAELDFERLHLTAVCLDDGADLALPDEVPTVDATNDADLLVLSGETGTDAERAVDWLAAGRAVALLGDAAESTWLEWARSDVYRRTFGGGLSEAEPDPNLLVAAAVGTHVRTYRHTWADGPRDRDVLRALDEDLVDVETRTPA